MSSRQVFHVKQGGAKLPSLTQLSALKVFHVKHVAARKDPLVLTRRPEC